MPPGVYKHETGQKSSHWLGDKVGYGGIHTWMTKTFGAAKNYPCMFCGAANGGKRGRIEWANLDHKYTRNLLTWTTLCVLCHRNYDSKTFKSYSFMLGRKRPFYPHKNRKIKDIDRLKEEYKSGKTQVELSKKYKIDQSTISRIINGKRYVR